MNGHPELQVRADRFLGETLRSEVRGDVTFRIERLIGQGATARAYYAIRQSPEGLCPVVLKIILPEVVRDSGETAQLVIQKESVALGRLNERIPRSPYVVHFVDTGTVSFSMSYQVISLPWLALEYVNGGIEGTCLDERIAYAVRTTGSAFDGPRASRTIEALARGLEEIHEVGVVHRDLTPGNVLCCGSGDTELFKVSDFGIARPMGLKATFGNLVVGTPGYIAPEQSLDTDKTVGPRSDVFSFAAIVYYLLTGEHYFHSRTAVRAYDEIRRPERRSLAEASGLSALLRERPAALSALDSSLARATSADPDLRPTSARLFADGILPWLRDERVASSVSPRWVQSFDDLSPRLGVPTHEWLVRHGVGDDRVILSAAWNAAGHCLAATTTGLQYFDGAAWTSMPATDCLAGRRVLSVRRLHPTSWLLCASGGRIAQVAREATTVIADAPDQSIDLLGANGDLDDLCVFIGTTEQGTWVLCSRVGRRWLRPFAVPGVKCVSALTRIDDERWLVVGRGDKGYAWAAIYSPLALTLEPIEAPEGRAILDCVSRRGRRFAIAVGGDGGILVMDNGVASVQKIESSPDLSAVTMDMSGQVWMASMASIWHRSPMGHVDRVWHDSWWRSPFIDIHAELGHLIALSVDGGVLEGRVNLIGPTMPA